MDQNQDELRKLLLLEEIERDPDTTQANLALRLGVAVGTVNWYIKRLVSKGYIKVKQAERRKLRYIITPDGVALRARLTLGYVEDSMALYRRTREQAKTLLHTALSDGYEVVLIQGDGDLAEVCRLTCLELGLKAVTEECIAPCAVLEVSGKDLHISFLQHDREREVMSPTVLSVDSMDQRI